jgi:hypothetical protein
MLTQRLILTFHQIVSEETGNDITLARAKSMVALACLTWPKLELNVTFRQLPRGRIIWRSDDLDSLSIGGAFRRDPVGEDAPIIVDRINPEEIVMPERMRECAAFIPLFGRRRLERFDRTMAQLFTCREKGSDLPAPDSPAAQSFHCGQEYRHLYDWLQGHGTIGASGEWVSAPEESFDRTLEEEVS